MTTLEGRRILVTGGSLGIGREVACLAAAAGARLVLAARGRGALDETLSVLAGSGHEALELDVASHDAWRRAVSALGTAQPLNGLVCVAGIFGPIGPIGSYDPESFGEAVAVNLLGTLLAVHHCLPHLVSSGGAVVTFSGGGATSPLPRFDAYAASKAAVVRLTENLAGELKGRGVRINSVAPGFVATRLQDEVLAAGPERAGAEYVDSVRTRLEEGTVSAEVAAELTVFLLSDEAAGITGKLVSAQWDPWREPAFRQRLVTESDFATLRRIDGVFYDRADVAR